MIHISLPRICTYQDSLVDFFMKTVLEMHKLWYISTSSDFMTIREILLHSILSTGQNNHSLLRTTIQILPFFGSLSSLCKWSMMFSIEKPLISILLSYFSSSTFRCIIFSNNNWSSFWFARLKRITHFERLLTTCSLLQLF